MRRYAFVPTAGVGSEFIGPTAGTRLIIGIVVKSIRPTNNRTAKVTRRVDSPSVLHLFPTTRYCRLRVVPERIAC